MKAKKYIWSMICVYMAYLTHGMQALIFSQNQVNFATKWGFDMTDPSSAAYAAGVAAVSTAISLQRRQDSAGTPVPEAARP